MIFTVQKGIPIPPKVYRGRYSEGSTAYPWDQMDRGDSFAFPFKYLNRVRVAAGSINSKGEKFFTVRETDKGARCWRLR